MNQTAQAVTAEPVRPHWSSLAGADEDFRTMFVASYERRAHGLAPGGRPRGSAGDHAGCHGLAMFCVVPFIRAG